MLFQPHLNNRSASSQFATPKTRRRRSVRRHVAGPRLTVEELPPVTKLPALNLAKLFDDIEAEVGLFDGPPDLAAELDHYLYGTPKTNASDGR